ncbi:gluconolaconase [Lentzea pudingi]|uniref:Gluconolaconase n=1 Tax=Lentzea pudingi TaxID=1789439 RepID=A0ABQ2IQ20_9PSEU|nr:SMP-30/gluconolactonase/LRE family protein [Lentzea pudingi]GGN23428.1 gluconolaconase [Lentzea pudingi]
MRARYLVSAMATLAVVMTAGAGLASGGENVQAPRSPKGALPDVINASAPSLHPEGVAWDPARKSFLVGSVRHGTVSVVGLDGQTQTLVNEPRIVSTVGVHVDVKRNRVLAAYADYGVGTRSTEATAFTQAGLGIFDLTTGRTLHLVNLAIGPGPHVANDFALDPAGNAYVTDTASDKIFKVDVNGRASLLAQDPRFTGPAGDGLNGIVWHPGGYLLAVRYDTGSLLRISLRDPVSIVEVRLDQPLVGGDGMLLRPDGTLVVATNALGQSLEGTVRELRSRDGWASATTTRNVSPWTDPVPSTVALTSNGSYVISGRIDLLIGGTLTDEFTLRRF